MEATIKTLVTKGNLANSRREISDELALFREEMRRGFQITSKKMKEIHAQNIKWMFFFSVTQAVAFWLMLEFLVKK